jgi:hypothetical protein
MSSRSSADRATLSNNSLNWRGRHFSRAGSFYQDEKHADLSDVAAPGVKQYPQLQRSRSGGLALGHGSARLRVHRPVFFAQRRKPPRKQKIVREPRPYRRMSGSSSLPGVLIDAIQVRR